MQGASLGYGVRCEMVGRMLRMAATLAIILTALSVCVTPAIAQEQPSVLVVDGGCGDADLAVLHWLGEDAKVIAEVPGKQVLTCTDPAWWGMGAPATFMLRTTDAQTALGSKDVPWALDAIRASGADPRTFVVGVGSAGLLVRAYAEDLTTPAQSSRADLVGCVLCGTPNNGYGASALYPECDLWARLGAGTGMGVADLAPEGTLVSKLNAGTFPKVTKSLVLMGGVGDLSFGICDGAGTATDLALAPSVAAQVEQTQVGATISRAINLSGAWAPFTSSVNYPDRVVDAKLSERLSAMECYETSDDVIGRVKEFYASWFGESAPVTHASYVVLLDLSGSMNESIDARMTKLDAARQALKEYLHAMGACAGLPLSAPIDVSIIGFGEGTQIVTNTYESTATAAIDAVAAVGETDVGLALDTALDTLAQSPTCSTKRILLVSDGASTQGKSDGEIMASSVGRAQSEGIVIDAVGFGDVGESNANFLRGVVDATKGTYYPVADTYTLRVDFLRSYYSSLGLQLTDETLKAQVKTTETLLRADECTSALQFGIVSKGTAPTVKLLLNGVALPDDGYHIGEVGGLTTLQCVSPQVGDYALELSGLNDDAQVFAVRQQGIVSKPVATVDESDFSLAILIGAGVLLVVGITVLVVLTRRGGANQRGGASQ